MASRCGRVRLEKREPMLDYGTLPPEINSARMYSGAGSESMMAAAAAWEGLANALESVSRVYSSTIARLQDEGWSGGASEVMASAAAPYVAWMTTAGVQAEEAASQARAAAAAYETAFAATVPPALVTANRNQLATLLATSFLGQNSAGIAALEAQYEQMWAQDAAAMYDYAASSSAATTLGQFTPPPRTTNAATQPTPAAAAARATGSPTAGNAQTTLSQLMSSVPRELQALATGFSNPAQTTGTTPMLDVFSTFNTLTGPASLGSNLSRTTTSALSGYSGISRTAIQSGNEAAKAASAAANAATAGADSPGSEVVRGPVLASSGNATTLAKTMLGGTTLAKLSVPQSWTTTNPPATPVAEPPWLSDADIGGEPAWEEVPATNIWSGVPAAGTGTKSGLLSGSSVNKVLRVGPRKFTMPRPSLGG
jgi:PPE-repeat protein